MRLRKIIQRRIRERRDGVAIAGDVNAAISANVAERNAVTDVSSTSREKQRSDERRELTEDEVKRQQGERLPEREAMSLIDANVAAPVNAAAALNVLSDDSTAIANAEQSTDIQQSTE
jgi:hypothetical protein